MEVILNSEIARLVLGYLKDQNLDKAHRKFCQTSKYLKDEFMLLSRGYQPVSVSNSNLIEIIKEYCEIKSQINQFINSFPNEILGLIQSQPNLTKRLEFIISKAKAEVLREADSSFIENTATKRKRSMSMSSTSDTESTQNDSSFVKPASYYRKSKMLKMNTPNIGYTLLRSKNKNSIRMARNSNKDTYDDSEDQEISTITDLSTLKETLLDNTEFQNKLAANINKIIQTGVNDKNDDEGEKEIENAHKGGSGNAELQFDINNAIDNIINTIEQDPIFDHIIKDVVNQQSSLYDDKFEIINNEEEECNTNEDTSDREPLGISRSSTPKTEEVVPVTTVVNKPAAPHSPNISIHPKTENNIGTVTERCDRNQNAFIISNESIQAEVEPSLTTCTSQLIITPNAITTQAQHQSNQPNLIFINEPTFNSAVPLINLTNTSSNQFPFLMPSSMLNESNLSLPFIMNSSPCVPISTAQFPMNFMAQPQALTTVPVPVVRRGRPRKIMAPHPIPQQTKLTSTQIHQFQMNTSNLKINKNNTIMTRSTINSTPITYVVTTSSNVLTTVTRTSQNSTCDNTFKSAQAAPKMNSNIMSNGNKSNAETQSTSVVQPIIAIVHSKIETPEKLTEVIESRVASNDESITTDMPSTKIKETSNIDSAGLEIKSTQMETTTQIQRTTTQIEGTAKITSVNEKQNSITPTQTKKLIENLKVKSNSTPRRKSHVRILDFTTPGRSEQTSQQVPKTIERSINLKSNRRSKSADRPNFDFKEKPVKRNKNNHDEITTTPKVKKSTKQCVRVLSRSTSEENYENESEKFVSNSEIKSNNNVMPGSTTKVGTVNLSTNLSPMDEWKQLRNVSQTKNWDSYLRFMSSVETVNKTKAQLSEEAARRKMHKLKLMKERKQRQLTMKRLKKSVRKSPRLQKNRKGKFVQKIKKSKMKVATEIEKVDVQVEPIQKETKEEETQQTSNDVIETVVVIKEVVLPEVVAVNNEPDVPKVHPTQSMASLLETPFKSDLTHAIPITPRFLPPLAVEDTPITKILKSLNKHLGSDLKHDIFTPSFALTPGCNLTPPKSLDIMTPQSGSYSNRPTDYSSGSSYYRPDESDDKLVTVASTSRNTSSVHEFEYETISTNNAQTEKTETAETKEIRHEKTNEKIIVECPGVLEKVKSFSENSNPIPENIVLHYTFNVPDENAEPVDIDAQDSDTSNSSCSCSDSSSSSSSSSDSSNKSYHPKTELEPSGNQIINEEGEIRYPIRTWITPKKQEMLDESTDRNKSSTLITNKQNVLMEMEEKRIRMRDKLKVTESVKSKVKKPDYKFKKIINPRQGVKQPLVSSKASTVRMGNKPKTPRKNPTPKKLVPLKSDKSEKVALQSKSFEADANKLIAVLSDDQYKNHKENQKSSDKVSIKSDDIELAAEFNDVYHDAISESEDGEDEECELVLQSNVLYLMYDAKSSSNSRTNEKQPNDYRDYLQSSKSVMNVNIDGAKVQIKATDIINLYECAPNKTNISIHSNSGPNKTEQNKKLKSSKTSDSKYKSHSKDKYDSQATEKPSKSNRGTKSSNRPLQDNTTTQKKSKSGKPSGSVIPESPVKLPDTSTKEPSPCVKAKFNVKHKIPKHQIAWNPVKKPVINRQLGSGNAPTKSAVQLSDKPEGSEINQSFKIPIKVDMKNKPKPSSSDTINAVLAHLHGTE